MTRPRALDLFCGAGGAAMGLYRAGFDIVGIDNRKQPRYPFPFIRADALRPPVRLEDFDLVWASPPCQHASLAAGRNSRTSRARAPNLIPRTRELLQKSGHLHVIENVPQAKLVSPVTLDGTMFPMRHRRTERRRIFESNFFILAPPVGRRFGPCTHPEAVTVAGHPGTTFSRYYRKDSGKSGGYRGRAGTKDEWAVALDIDWMSGLELAQAIPPAYAEHIGRYAMMALGRDQ